MDGLTLTATKSFSAIQSFPQSSFHFRNSRIFSFPYRKPRNISVFASKDDPKLDEWDQMELKFGRMIGEDPKITLAKIMGRKSNPDLSYLEIEKLLEKKKGKSLNEEIEEVPFDLSDKKKPTAKSEQGLNLSRPVPKKGTKFEATNNKAVESDTKDSTPSITKPTKETKSSIPDVILRKPGSFYVNDGGKEKSSRLEMKPNLSLKMGKEPQKERFSDITLLKKPQATVVESGDENGRNDSSDGAESSRRNDASILLKKPELMSENNPESELDKGSATEFQADISNVEKPFASDGPSRNTSMENVLIGKPKRLDRPVKATDQITREELNPGIRENLVNPVELEKFLANSPIKEREEDWARAEEVAKRGERVVVELISCSTRGFVASFISLIGFLPYRNLATKWKFLAFESWLRKNGLDPSIYRQNLGIVGKYEATSTTDTSESGVESETSSESDGMITSDMKLEDLLMMYDQEKLKFLSSFIGQRVRVGLVLVDRNSRRLIFSIKPREKEELIEKKRSLMARLSVGDVVKCCIKKITYFGVFVEVEGVPALIHQTEVSWDATLDPASYFKVGQIVDAKVHQLDFSLERIFLSLKEITPDPMIEALEAVVGDHGSLVGELEAAQADTEWSDVESLMKELQQFDGIQSVSKGRYFLSPGLAPTFQVYMASMFENQYKLLARAGNRVQEVIVQTELSKEELKSAIMTCTNRVA